MHQPDEHVGFDAYHHATQTVDFPMNDVVARLDGTTSSTAPLPELAGDGLLSIMQWAWRGPTNRPANMHAAFVKFLALSATMRPEIFDGQTYKQLGSRVGVTRADISKAAVNFTRQFGLHFRRQHNGISNMRAARIHSYQMQKFEAINSSKSA